MSNPDFDMAHLWFRPVHELATHFGVALQVITSDGYTFFSERGQTAVDSHVFFPSVAEGSSRPADANDKMAPDVYRTAIRGIHEELGIEIEKNNIEWLSFGANVYLCEYGLIGCVEIKETWEELIRIREIGTPKDKWESARLYPVVWRPQNIVDFLSENGLWSPFALVTIVHAMIFKFDRAPSEIVQLFQNHKISCSQPMPS